MYNEEVIVQENIEFEYVSGSSVSTSESGKRSADSEMGCS